MQQNNPSTSTPDAPPAQSMDNWLRALEAQSWQAELLISGIVIAGLIQVPDLFIHWAEGYLLASTGLGHTFINMASMFVLGAVNALIVFFGIHFIFRSIWIALLGLNSVYPEGINIHSTKGAGEKYWKKMKKKYPDLSLYNQDLDRQCSLIFSYATALAIVMVSFSIIILIAYQIALFLIALFPFIKDYIVPIGIGLYLLFTIGSLGLQQLVKKYPANKQYERYFEGYTKIASGLFSLYIFEKPINYISNITMSNSTSKLGGFLIFLFCGLLGFTAAMQVSNHPIYNYFGEVDYFTFNNRPHRTLIYNYENLRDKETQIFTPIIPSDIVSEKVLKLFIPIIEREEEAVGLVSFSFWERFNWSQAERDAAQRADLKKYATFNQIFVNDKVYRALDFQYYTHPNAGEFGLLSYIPTDQFSTGKNLLEIKKNYFYQDSLQKIVAIPFYFERE